MVLEELHEGGGVGKIECLGDFPHGEVGGFEHHFYLGDDGLVYPFEDTFAGDLFDLRGEILGCEVHLLGIERHGAFAFVVFGQQEEKVV